MFLGWVLSGFTATTFRGNYILNTRTLLCHSSKPVGEIRSPNGHIVGNITLHLTVPVWSDLISCWTTQDEDKLPLNMPFDFEIWPYYVVDGPSTSIRWFSPFPIVRRHSRWETILPQFFHDDQLPPLSEHHVDRSILKLYISILSNHQLWKSATSETLFFLFSVFPSTIPDPTAHNPSQVV